MERVIHRASGRGVADQGSVKSYYTFSYYNYYDPRKIHFGALRILNDITMDGGEGFRSHTRDNMEIVTIPVEGVFEYGDNMGNLGTVGKGEVQVISAGTSVTYNEYNKSQTEPLRLLQIWIYPREYDLPPKYNAAPIPDHGDDEAVLIAAPYGDEEKEGIARISQGAWFYIADLSEHGEVTLQPHRPTNGIYIFVLDGEVAVCDTALFPGDGLGASEMDSLTVRAEGKRSKVLFIEVPMNK